MRLGLAILAGETNSEGNVISRYARAAEEHGLDSVWFYDTISRGGMSLDPLLGASVAAAVTNRIEVGTSIVQVPLRHPVELAQRVLTAQLVCGGRLTLGVGAGSAKGDFEAVDKPYDDRMRLLTDGLALMRRLWDGETVNGANLMPLPSVKGGPPLLIGSWGGARWIPRAARDYDGWIASGYYASYDALTGFIEEFRKAGGKRAVLTNIHIDLDAETQPMDDMSPPFNLRCAPDEAARRLKRIAGLGFDDAVVVHKGQGEPDLEAIRRLLPPD